jgi:hypothetical protein
MREQGVRDMGRRSWRLPLKDSTRHLRLRVNPTGSSRNDGIAPRSPQRPWFVHPRSGATGPVVSSKGNCWRAARFNFLDGRHGPLREQRRVEGKSITMRKEEVAAGGVGCTAH